MSRLVAAFLLSVIAFAAVAMFAPDSASADIRDFEFRNDSPVVVLALYVSPAHLNSWGPDILGVDVVEPGGGGFVVFDESGGTCIYDIKVETANGDAFLYDIDLCVVELVRVT